MSKDFKRFICMLLAVLMCLSLLTAAMASEEPDETEPETSADIPAAGETATEEPEADETAPAEDGIAYYEKEFLGQTEKEKVQVQSWVRADKSYYFLEKGDSAELRVVVDTDRSDVTYEWSYAPGYDGEYERIEGADGPVYSVEYTEEISFARYSCLVTCGDEEEEEISFSVNFWKGSTEYVRKLYVYPKGTDRETQSAYLSVALGANVSLSVCVENENGESLANSISGGWSRYYYDNNGQRINETLEDTGTSISVEKVDRTCVYRYSAWDENSGSSDYAEFSIEVENHFTGDKIRQTGGVTQLEYHPYDGYTLMEILVKPGDPLTLESLAQGDRMDGMTYMWEDNRSPDGHYEPASEEDIVTTRVFSLDSVDMPGYIGLNVYDVYGNSGQVSVRIILDNGFSVAPAGAKAGRHEIEMPMGRGGKATLKVNVTANDTSKLSYDWGCITAGGEWIRFKDETYTIQPFPGQTGEIGNQPVTGLAGKTLKKSDELIVEKIPETITYFCCVSDGFGNEEYAYFHLNIRNARYGTAGRQDPLDANNDGLENAADAPIFISRQELFEAMLLVKKLVGLKAN